MGWRQQWVTHSWVEGSNGLQTRGLKAAMGYKLVGWRQQWVTSLWVESSNGLQACGLKAAMGYKLVGWKQQWVTSLWVEGSNGLQACGLKAAMGYKLVGWRQQWVTSLWVEGSNGLQACGLKAAMGYKLVGWRQQWVTSSVQIQMSSTGILPLVILFITTQVKVWCTLNRLPVTQIKMVWSHTVVYCMTNERKAYNYLFILMQVCHDLVFHNYIYPNFSKATNWTNSL